MFFKRFRLSRRTSGPREVPLQDALRTMFRLGKEAGRTAQPPVVYRQFCERHSEQRLQEIQHGVFVCPVCRMQVAPPLVVTPIDGREPRTDQMREISARIPPGALMRDYRRTHLSDWNTCRIPTVRLSPSQQESHP